MNKLVVFCMTLMCSSIAFSKAQLNTMSEENSNKAVLQQMAQNYLKPRGILATSYDEFKFNSQQGTLFYNYSGNTNFTAVGGDLLPWRQFYWGVNGYNITTDMNSSQNLNNSLTLSHSDIEDTGIYAHVMKDIVFPFYIDVFASYARDRYKTTNTVLTNGQASTGFTKYYGNDKSIGVRTFFGYPFKKFLLQGNLTYFHSEFYQPTYIIPSPAQNLIVPELVTKLGTTLENARLYYQVNDHFSPFITGGLIQLLSRSFNRPLIAMNTAPVAVQPQILLAKTGFNVGAGLDYQYKTVRVTPMYVYSERGSTFKDNYVGVTVELTGLA
ncbi:autotransporter outer membrane beta-barrel domain-containing protein [Legionella waltersii]|uniref:Autotransporter domain-containing protein n=1 Tax=Legionella waltersii TaxID=66969 RepID=A0A0W1A603_9GAMM|nr:autotransporter outer membrane beta-barrel domain-containing protein [Legionella waltersii]KTD76435.1 hypothetical protein Lwal_2157 [Legionella waltersii]SNV14433.1 Uncharacterised protein [Legionella waltersii]